LAFPETLAPIARALTERKYEDPTPVQLAVLEAKAEGRDMVVSAQTGSGKTVAYGLAIATTLLGDKLRFENEADPLALIVAPTRELALQVERELAWLYAFTGARILSCVGGMDPNRERRRLHDGAHIIVGTPGRLRDHLERGALKINDLKAVVLDEADEMLDLGFREDLEFILEATPKDRQTLMFSATMPKPIALLAKKYQRDALRIEAKGSERAHADIEYRAMRVAPNEVEHAVVNVLRFVESQSAIVFCNTRDHVRHLHATLSERGFSAVNLSGELSQSERNHALQALRDGRARVCVATDVAARGIDLPNLNLVIHADLPNDAETLQHRSGRTGRAGRKGVSVLLVPLSRRRKAEQMLATAKVSPVWSGPPLADDIRKLDQQRMLQDPILTAVNSEEDLEMARSVLANRQPEEIAAALVRIYRSRLPAAEDVFDPGPGDNRGARSEFREAKPLRRKEAGDTGPRDFTWFKLDIGRKNNADPKWLLPMICRRGHVTKPDIGAIRINENETRFEIANHAVEKFATAMLIADKDDVAISRLDGAAPAPKSERKRSFERSDGFKPKPRAEATTAYEDRKPHDAEVKPRYEGKKSFTDKPKFKPKFEGGKPKFAGKPKEGGFKVKKAPWDKKK
jgi:ATP-dependent RNA helicase DeaD